MLGQAETIPLKPELCGAREDMYFVDFDYGWDPDPTGSESEALADTEDDLVGRRYYCVTLMPRITDGSASAVLYKAHEFARRYGGTEYRSVPLVLFISTIWAMAEKWRSC